MRNSPGHLDEVDLAVLARMKLECDITSIGGPAGAASCSMQRRNLVAISFLNLASPQIPKAKPVRLSETIGNGARSWCAGSRRSSLQILDLKTPCSYTRLCFPFVGMEGQTASPTGPATGTGTHPVAETRHKPMATPRSEENMISRLSAVHAGDPMIGRRSKVRRLGLPPPVDIT